MPSLDTVLTVQDLAARLGHPVHRVRYVLKTRQIPPLRVMSGLRVFGPDVLPVLQDALDGSGKRGGRPRVLGVPAAGGQLCWNA